MRQINAPDIVSGVYSMYLRKKKSNEKLILEKMVADAKELIEVDFLIYIYIYFNY